MSLTEALLRLLAAAGLATGVYLFLYHAVLGWLIWKDGCESCRRRPWRRAVLVDGGFFLVCTDCEPTRGDEA